MRGTGILLIVVAVVMGAVAMTSGTSRPALMGAAGIMLFVGLMLLFVAAYVMSKRKALMSQMEQFNAAAATTSTGQTTSVDVENMMNLDANDILKTVMDAQKQSGGDPDALAKALQEKFGGEAMVVEGGSQTAFSSGAFSGGGSNDMLAQLTKLGDEGMLTDQQFEEQKQRLINPGG